MISLLKALKLPRLMKALTGLTPDEFSELLPTFERGLKARRSAQGIVWGIGRPHTLSTMADKLFFILFYTKCYPTFDVLSFIYNADRHRTHDWFKELLTVLENTLGKKVVLPVRKISSPEEFFALFPEVKEAWIDGTERPTQRPGHKIKQKNHYSGKKKRHTLKNLVISGRDKSILVLTRTEPGKKHDYQKFKDDKLGVAIPDSVTSWFDCGFQGVRKDFPNLIVKMPKRASRGHPLTKTDKKQNQQISRQRILVENSIGGIKRFRSVTDVFRNHTEKYADQLMLISAGLWNFHLQKS